MTDEIFVLAGTAAGIGFIHTILGPDHYLPFIVMSKARGWTGRKTAVVTSLCGLGHVTGSIVLGALGIFLGAALFNLETFESFRGDLAAWLLIAFGLVYFLWGIRRAIRGRTHEHAHHHGNDQAHNHSHCHLSDHSHVHSEPGSTNLTPWILFIRKEFERVANSSGGFGNR